MGGKQNVKYLTYILEAKSLARITKRSGSPITSGMVIKVDQIQVPGTDKLDLNLGASGIGLR